MEKISPNNWESLVVPPESVFEKIKPGMSIFLGPAGLLAFALNGFVTLLTALSYAELASSYPKSGGGYSYERIFRWNFEY